MSEVARDESQMEFSLPGFNNFWKMPEMLDEKI